MGRKETILDLEAENRSLQTSLAEAKRQRDELLALCEKLAAGFEDALECEDGWARPWDYQLVEKAQAAIARARSGQQEDSQ